MDINIESRSLLLRRNSHRELSGGALVSSAPINNRLLIGWCTSCSGKRQSRAETSAPPGRRKFIVEKKLPQISRIYTDVSKMFCVFREFCGSKYLCKSVKSVGEYSLPVCSVNSVNSVGGFNIGALSDMLVHFLLWQAAKPSGDKCTPWSVHPKTSSAGTTALRADRCRQQDSIGCCCGTPCRLR